MQIHPPQRAAVKMRKGFSLIEMLVVMVIFASSSVAITILFNALVAEIPRSWRVIQENTTVLSMLKQLREDISVAKGLPESFGAHTTDDKRLLIELPEGIICYQLQDGKIFRARLTNAYESSGEDIKVWSAPHAQVQWRVLRQDQAGYAVEVKTHIEHKVAGHLEKKLANCQLYFVGLFERL